MKFRVGILGATGLVGQRYILLLNNHPWFEVAFLAASQQSAGKTYQEATKNRWHMSEPLPESISKVMVHSIDQIKQAQSSCDFVFSALDNLSSQQYEHLYAAADLPVISNCSTHRWTNDVPMLIPEINPQHSQLILQQKKNRGWKKGFIVTKPNCSLQSFLLPLAILRAHANVSQAIVTTFQALSGAGHPGVSALDIMDNVVPFISGEEEKTEREPLKILGTFNEQSQAQIEPLKGLKISSHCNRVPTLDGHQACVSFKLEGASSISANQIIELWQNFRGEPQKLNLPSAPAQPILYYPEENRPQVRKDRLAENGMAVNVGRLRPCSVLDWRFVGLSHNLIRGAAGGNVLNAELLVAQGYLKLDA